RIRLRDREWADLGSPERLAVAAESGRDRAHVGSGADEQIEPGDAVAVVEQLELADDRPAEWHLDGDPAPVEPVGALAADLDGGGGGNRQLDLAAKAVERLPELVRRRRLVLVHDLALRVARRRPGREIHLGQISLAE